MMRYNVLVRFTLLILILHVCFQSALTQQSITGEDYMLYESIYNKLKKLNGNLREVEYEENRSDIINMFKDGKKSIVYNDIKGRGTTLEEYLSDLSKVGRRIYDYQGVYFKHSPENMKRILVYIDVFNSRDKNLIEGPTSVYKAEVGFVKGKFVIYSFLPENNRIDLSGMLKYTYEFETLAEQAFEKNFKEKYEGFDDQKLNEKSIEFFKEYALNHKIMTNSDFSPKKSARKRLLNMISKTGEFEDYKSKKTFSTNEAFITSLNNLHGATLMENTPVIKPVSLTPRKNNAKKSDLVVKVEYLINIDNRIVPREAHLLFRKLKDSGESKKRLLINKLVKGNELDARDKKFISETVTEILSSYISVHASVPGSFRSIDEISSKFFVSNSSEVFLDIAPQKKMLPNRKYLELLRDVNLKSKFSYHINEISGAMISEVDDSLFYCVTKIDINHEIYTDSSVLSVIGSLNAVTQFKKGNNGLWVDFKIEKIYPHGNIKIKESRLLDDTDKPIKRDNATNLLKEDDLVRNALLNQGVIKSIQFIQFLNKYSKKSEFNDRQIDEIEKLFFMNGNHSKIGVSNYNRKNKYEYFSISDYFFIHLKSLGYNEFIMAPDIISDMDSVVIRKIDGIEHKWITAIRFKQNFDGIHKRRQNSYCDETLKDISIIIIKEGENYNAYLDNITPVKNGTKKRDCNEKKRKIRARL